MGGKNRTKNGVKPSSSSRAAALINFSGQSSTPLGFSLQTNAKTTPFVFGLATSTTDDRNDGNINSEQQMIFRKLSKKDPVTRKKALQELIAIIKSTTTAEETTGILNLWTEYYKNIIVCIENYIRESSQTVLTLLAEKQKRGLAPYLKKLLPVWIASQFDTYRPAANVASSSFHKTFGGKPNRLKDVCTRFEKEILDYAIRNLTYYTPERLAKGNDCPQEEPHQTYLRIIQCSLKTLTYFLELTQGCVTKNYIKTCLTPILEEQKIFWTIYKNEKAVRPACLQLLYYYTGAYKIDSADDESKSQFVSRCFKNLKNYAHQQAWPCHIILYCQLEDWQQNPDIRNLIVQNFSHFICENVQKNSHIAANELHAFLMKLNDSLIVELHLKEFSHHILITFKNLLSKVENHTKPTVVTLNKAYFVCLEWLLVVCEKYDDNTKASSGTTMENQVENEQQEQEQAQVNAGFYLDLLQNNIREITKNMLNLNTDYYVNFYFNEVIALIKSLERKQQCTTTEEKSLGESKFKQEILNTYWQLIVDKMNEIDAGMKEEEMAVGNERKLLLRLLKFISTYITNGKDDIETFKITNEVLDNLNNYKLLRSSNVEEAQMIPMEILQISYRLAEIFMNDALKQKNYNDFCEFSKYIMQIKDLQCIQESMDIKMTTLPNCAELCCVLNEPKNEENALKFLSTTIEMLRQLKTKEERFDYIKSLLTELSIVSATSTSSSILLVERLFSYPLCLDLETIQMTNVLPESKLNELLISAANALVKKRNPQHYLKFLQKYFTWQMNNANGQFPIQLDVKIVNEILEILVGALLSPFSPKYVKETCGNLLAEIMPMITTQQQHQISCEIKTKVFVALFETTAESACNKTIYTEHTLWKIIAYWQNALTDGTIILNHDLYQTCLKSLQIRLPLTKELTPKKVAIIAGIITKLMIEGIESMKQNEENFAENVDAIFNTFFYATNMEIVAATTTMQHLTTFLEILMGKMSPIVLPKRFHGQQNLDIIKIQINCLIKLTVLLNLLEHYEEERKDNSNNSGSSSSNNNNSSSNSSSNSNSDAVNHQNMKMHKKLKSSICTELTKCVYNVTDIQSLLNLLSDNAEGLLEIETKVFASVLLKKLKTFMSKPTEIVDKINEELLKEASKENNPSGCRPLTFLVNCDRYSAFEENGIVILTEDLVEYFIQRNTFNSYLNTLQYLLPYLHVGTLSISPTIMGRIPDKIWFKSAFLRTVTENNFKMDMNTSEGLEIISCSLQFITNVMKNRLDEIIPNVNVNTLQPFNMLRDRTEFINFLIVVLEKFPHVLSNIHWDLYCIGLNAWSKSLLTKPINDDDDYFQYNIIYLVQVFKLYRTLIIFFDSQRRTSSTQLLARVIDEWDQVFCRDICQNIFHAFYKLCQLKDNENADVAHLVRLILPEVIPSMEYINYSYIYKFCESSTDLPLNLVTDFLFDNLSMPNHGIRKMCAYIIKELIPHFVQNDFDTYNKKPTKKPDDSDDDRENPIADILQTLKLQFLAKMYKYIKRYGDEIRHYLSEFNFKVNDIHDMQTLDRDKAFSYLLLWDCIITACAKAPVALRSVYTNWILELKYEEELILFLFRAMPVEILKNYDSRSFHTENFKYLTASFLALRDSKLTIERYACHLYTEVLRKLPALVRKWWNGSQSRQKSFVDKLTTNYVSPIICNEELKLIASKKETHENMQITVHTSTREVMACYLLDDTRMELVISLAQNYPLGSVTVKCGKQIGGRLSARNVSMQLTLFLTHQNGSIYDGLTMWKNNLDKKFEGIEECYVCYTVIHQETCQLPKLSCRTCKKKFHGPCLYKWFTTSSKSTCPICRNVF